ncbi:MAG: GlsB/YeaQ/YmgE family stress response membrane protein [Hyphomonas sp.]
MTIESLLIFLFIGAVAGWLAGVLVKGYGFGIVGNIIVGIIGAFVAGLIFPAIGLSIGGGILGSIIYATLGAVVLLLAIRLVKQA